MTDNKAIGYLFLFAVFCFMVGTVVTMILNEDNKAIIADSLTLIFLVILVAVLYDLSL